MSPLSRRYFMFGSLLTGALPRPSIASLKALGYQSPNEKLNIAGIGAGGQPLGDMRQCTGENIVALADVDWKRGEQGFKTFEKARKHKDFRQMLDKEGKQIDAVVIGTPDHMHAYAALACMQAGKSVYVEKPLTRTPWEARLLTQAAEACKVATQMGNQGYSHDATRVACEIFWSGEIGEVREVHAWTGRASWPQEMSKTPAPTPVPDTLDWDLWLGTAASRPFTAGDQEYKDFIAERDARRPRLGGGGGGPIPGGAPAGRGGGGFPGADSFGFFLPFNWRAFYDFGSGLIGDWGVHILGPANWALQLHPKHLLSVECIKKNTLPPFTFPDELTIKYEFGARGSMPPVTVYWYHSPGGDAYLPPGMTVERARKIPGKGPQVGPVGGGGNRPPGAPGGALAASGPPAAKQNYFKDRSLFYATFPISEQAPQGEWNYKLEPVYLVGILDFVFDEDKDSAEVIHRVQLKDQINRVFYDKLMFIYLEMPKFTKTEAELETPADKWLYALKHLPELTDRPAKLQERVFSRLFEIAEIGKFNRTERALYQDSLKVYRDWINVIDTAMQEANARGEARGEQKKRLPWRASH